MKLVQLNHAEFGTLKLEQPLRFADGINLLIAPNQSGKSTLITLLEWLLYGVPPKGTKRNVALVQDWAPWQGGEPAASLEIAPEADDWPERIRLDVRFQTFRPQLTDPSSSEDLSQRIRVSTNGTWNLGFQLTSLSRTAMQASLLARQGEMEEVLGAEDLRRALLSDLSELVEDPERANLEAALAALDKPAFAMGEEQPTPVQMPSLLRRSEEQHRMVQMQRTTLQEEFDRAEKLLNACSEAEQRQATEKTKLTKMKTTLAAQRLGAAAWRYGRQKTLRTRLESWEAEIRDQPWIAEFPTQLESDANALYGEWRQLGEVIEDRQNTLERDNRNYSNLEHKLKEKAPLMPLIEQRQQIVEYKAAIETADRELEAAETDRREYGEAADPAIRERFEQIDARLLPHREYLEAIKGWHGRHAECHGQLNEVEARKDELKSIARTGRPPQFYFAIVLLVVGLVVAIAGPKFLAPAWIAYAAGAAVIAIAAWLAAGSAAKTRLSDKAAIELEQVVQPRLTSLLADTAQLDQDAALLREHHAVSIEDWDGAIEVLPAYKELHYKLESYARACRERDNARQKIDQAWESLQAATAGAANPPPHPDIAWINQLLETIDNLSQANERVVNLNAAIREEQREISRHESDRQELLRRLAKLTAAVKLEQLCEADPAKAINRIAEYANRAREYSQLKSEYNNECDKCAALKLTEADFNQQFAGLRPEQQAATAGLVTDEQSFDKLQWGLRTLEEEIAQAKIALDQAEARAGTLREQVAANSSVLAELPVVIEREQESGSRAAAVRRWNSALKLVETTLKEIHAARRSNLAPKLNAALEHVLAIAPLSGIRGAGLGSDLEIRLEPDGAPPGLMGLEAADRLSAGARRQLALAVRMAVAATLGESASLPVILDEPLAELDDARSTDVLRYLGQVADGSQVLITSCHQQQYSWLLQQAGIKPEFLTLSR